MTMTMTMTMTLAVQAERHQVYLNGRSAAELSCEPNAIVLARMAEVMPTIME